MHDRPVCIEENCNNLAKTNGRSKVDGRVLYRSRCSPCDRARSNSSYQHRRYLKAACEQCGFVPEHSCQLDVDHKDGDHYNNNPSNLQTLCANCHRLKTKKCGDRKKKTLP